MRTTLTCPKCGGRKVWRIESFETESDSTSGWKLHIVYYRNLGGRTTTTGQFDAYICRACGYTEWYAHSFEELRPDPTRGVHLLDGDVTQGPFR